MDGINEFSAFHCSAEWHIELHCPNPASSIYNLAFRVARDSGRFTVSYPHLAEYFQKSQSTVSRAVHGLRDVGLFKLLANDPGHKFTYQPIQHREWAQQHPGQCQEKISPPAHWERDLLGQALFTQCDGRIKFFYPNVLKGMRATGLSDLEIVERMKTFRRIDKPEIGLPWTHGLVGRFMKYLKNGSNPFTGEWGFRPKPPSRVNGVPPSRVTACSCRYEPPMSECNPDTGKPSASRQGNQEFGK